MTETLVREAGPLDEKAAIQVEAQAFANLRQIYVPKPGVPTRASGEQPSFSRLVAERDGQIVGTVCWRVEADRLHLRALAVACDHRRRGIARALVTRCVDLARQSALRAVSAYTVAETGNVPIFQRLGFTVIRRDLDPSATTPAGLPVTEAYLELPTAVTE